MTGREESAAFFGVIDQRLAAKLTSAIVLSQRRRRSDGLPADGELDRFARALLSAYGGQAGTSFAEVDEAPDGEAMSGAPRLLTYEEVARRLGLSERQVKRLVADPGVPLAAVHIGTAARVHTDDLRDYMESLRSPEGISA